MPIGSIPTTMTTDAAISQFKAFESFAKSAGVKDRSIAQAGRFANGTFSINPKSGVDFIGNIGRRADAKTNNDTVRNIFLAAVIKMFGGTSYDESCLPASVREAMKIDDYDKGKPLSARRIRAVSTAVNEYVEGRALQLEQKLTGAGIPLNDDVKERIRTAVRSCRGDEDLFAVLLENPEGVLFSEESHPRNGKVLLQNAEVMQRVRDLAPEVDMLRRAIPDDKKLFNAARPFLAVKDDVPLSKPLLASMVEFAKGLKASEIGCFMPLLSASLHPSDVHAAAVGVGKLIDKAMQKTSPYHVKRDELSQAGYRQLIASMILTTIHSDKATVRKMQAALESEPARKLKRGCLDRADTFAGMAKDGAIPGNQAKTMDLYAKQWKRQADLLDELKTTLDVACDGLLSEGRPIEPHASSVTETDIGKEVGAHVAHEVTLALH